VISFHVTFDRGFVIFYHGLFIKELKKRLRVIKI